MVVFFFQAEDGIRDIGVTGVQTCALPILSWSTDTERRRIGSSATRSRASRQPGKSASAASTAARSADRKSACRERVEISVVAGLLKKKNTTVSNIVRHLTYQHIDCR